MENNDKQKLYDKLIRQANYKDKLASLSDKTEDFKSRQILYILYPIGVSSIDVTVASSAFKNLLQGIPTNISETPLIILASIIIVLIEMVLGQTEENKKKFFPNLFIMIVPIVALSEGFMRIGNHIQLDEPWPYFLSTSLLFGGLSLLSYISHREAFLKAPIVVDSYSGTYYYIRKNSLEKSYDKNELKIKKILTKNEMKIEDTDFDKLMKDYDNYFQN